MKLNEMFPSKYLRGLDMKGPVVVVIAGIRPERMYKPSQGQIDGWVLLCEKASKPVVLSRALAGSIAAALNEQDTDRWVGRQIVLYPEPMTVAGVPRVAIRARAAAQPQPAGVNGNGSGEAKT